MTDATHEDAGPVTELLAEALTDYLALLDQGVADPAVDAALRPLLGLQLNALGGPATTRVTDQIAVLRTAVRSSRTRTSVGVVATSQVSESGESGYAPVHGRSAGATWAAWLSFDFEVGDRLRIRAVGSSPAPTPTPTPTPNTSPERGGQRQVLVRPTLAAGHGAHDAWLMHAAPSDRGWQVWARPIGSPVTEPAELVSRGVDHAVNQEGVVDSSGLVHVVSQELHDGRFRVAYRVRFGDAWSEAELLSPNEENAWDPCVAVDGDRVCVVWSAYRRGLFRLVMRVRERATWGDEVEVPTSQDRHALHPHTTTDPDGGVWLAYDALAVPDQASSGLTRYQRADQVGRDTVHDPVPDFDLDCEVGVLSVRDGAFSTPVTAEPIADRSAACYPRVAIDAVGRLWIAYRSLRQLPFGDYVAHVAVRVHDGGEWSVPRLLPASDGTCAEFSLCPADVGVTVLYHGDGHAQRHVAMLRGHTRPTEYLSTEESMRREHLRLPSTLRMAAGGHVGGGPVTLAALDAAGPARRPGLALVERTTVTDDARSETSGARDHRPVGWPPEPHTQQLFWGDLHRHSNVSRCGAGLDIGAEDHYRFAADLLGCDFWALTDHAENTSELNWHHLKKLANAFYRPGSHASLIGFEWTSFVYGHFNVIYSGDDGPVLSSVDPSTDDPAKLWKQLEDHEALTIPHHPASWVYPTDWSFHSERFLRLVEVFQACTGSYESDWCHRQYHDALAQGSSVQDALGAGHRVGFIGSTDHGNGAAYVGLYADRLDRASVLQALADRRCFAATRRGIVPELRIGESWMGQEMSLGSAGTPRISFGGEGIAELSVVQLVRDGLVVASSSDRTAASVELTVPLDVQLLSLDGGPRALQGTVRVEGDAVLVPTQWCPPEFTAVASDSISWASVLPDRYGKVHAPPGVVNVGVTIRGRGDAVVTVDVAGASLRRSLAELAGGATHEALASGCELRVRRGTGGLTGLGATRWTGEAPAELLRPGSWFYVRVIQVDGETAWSSPVWVDA